MRNSWIKAAVTSVLPLLLLTDLSAAEPLTPEMFGALPTVSEAEVSPDGKTMAQIQSRDGVRAVAFFDLSGAKPPIGVKFGSVKARDLRWFGPDHVLVLVSASLDVAWGHGIKTIEVWRWVSINRNDGEKAFLFRSYTSGWYAFSSGIVYSTLPDDPEHIIMGQWVGYQLNLFRVNLRTGGEREIESGRGKTEDWIVSPSGKPLVRVDYDNHKEERQFLRPNESGRFKQVSALPEKLEDDPTIVAFASAGPDNLIHGDMSIDGRRTLCTFDVDKAETTQCDAIPNYDIDDAIIDYRSGRVVGVLYTDDFSKARFTDADLASVQRSLDAAMRDATPRITSWSDDRRKFVVHIEYRDHPPQIFIFDRDARRLDMWAATYEAIDGKSFAAREKYDHQSSDGLAIRGYLTVPAGADKKKMPLVVLPHGGPAARDNQGFDWWAYFYAARGYLVYQPNFRGSFGYGDAFRQAGYLQWGKKMQDDVTEGVRHLIADGLVDPSRICIVGGSYGGYAALVGATLTPDLYACAVSVAGVSSIPAQIAYQTDRGAVPEDAWDVRIGARVGDNAALQEVSPYYQAARARAPIMLIHGKDDIVVPIGQSLLMKAALEQAKKKVEFVELAGEDHWLSSGESRTEMLARSIAFIDTYIGPNAGAGN